MKKVCFGCYCSDVLAGDFFMLSYNGLAGSGSRETAEADA